MKKVTIVFTFLLLSSLLPFENVKAQSGFHCYRECAEEATSCIDYLLSEWINCRINCVMNPGFNLDDGDYYLDFCLNSCDFVIDSRAWFCYLTQDLCNMRCEIREEYEDDY